MPEMDVAIKRADQYSHDLAAHLGALMVHLSPDRTGGPIDEELLRPIIEEPSFEQILAIADWGIVGSAVVSLKRSNQKTTGWLENFVVHPHARGAGVADKIADEWEMWFRERGVDVLNFTSSWSKPRAHSFYDRRGAEVVSGADGRTAYFRYPIPRLVDLA